MRVLWVENGLVFNNYFIKYKPKQWFFELLLQEKLSVIRVNTQVIWRPFGSIALTHVKPFVPFKQVWSLGFLCTTAAIRSVFCLVFQNGIEPIFRFGEYPHLQLLSERGWFWDGENRKQKYARSNPGFPWQDGDVYILEQPYCFGYVWKHLKTCRVLLILY